MMHLLVTAGPTREFFDSVRFISNPSSGKMGYAVAAEAARRGHRVDLVSGPVSIEPPAGVELIRVTSAEEMFDAALSCFGKCQAAVMTAAVCDYRPAETVSHKLKKNDRPESLTLLPTKDIAAHLGAIKGRRILIGFAMEDFNPREHAAEKLRRKRCDAMVLNTIDNVGGDEATIEILQAGSGWSGPYSGTKSQLAATLVDLIEVLVNRVSLQP